MKPNLMYLQLNYINMYASEKQKRGKKSQKPNKRAVLGLENEMEVKKKRHIVEALSRNKKK